MFDRFGTLWGLKIGCYIIRDLTGELEKSVIGKKNTF